MFEDAFNQFPYAAFVLDMDGIIVLCNRRAQSRFCPETGRDPGAVAGASLARFTLHSEDELRHRLREGMAMGHAGLDMRATATGGTQGHCVFRLSLLRAPDPGQRFILLTQDHLKTSADALASMNERRRTTRENLLRLEAAHLELQQSLLSVEAFSRAASHDMRTPLNTLSGMLELFALRFAAELPEDAQDYLKTMGRAVTHMTHLTDTLLEHARSTTPDLNAEPVSVRPIARQVCLELDPQIEAVQGRVEMSGESFTVMAEPMLLTVLLTNIVSNALKYRATERPPVVRFHFEPGAAGRGRMSISDNGIGFSEQSAKDIFMPFKRLDRARDGSGIGLATCAEVCHRHGWTIEAHGEEGVGAQFVITF